MLEGLLVALGSLGLASCGVDSTDDNSDDGSSSASDETGSGSADTTTGSTETTTGSADTDSASAETGVEAACRVDCEASAACFPDDNVDVEECVARCLDWEKCWSTEEELQAWIDVMLECDRTTETCVELAECLESHVETLYCSE